MLSVIAAQNRNSPAQVVQKCARRLIDGTQCFHCDRLENVMQRSILLLFIIIIIRLLLRVLYSMVCTRRSWGVSSTLYLARPKT